MSDFGNLFGASNSRWAKALAWDRESQFRAMPTKDNPYRDKPKVNIEGAEIFFRMLRESASVTELFGWTYYYNHYSTSLEQWINNYNQTEQKKWECGWFKFSKFDVGDNTSCFINLDKYNSMTVNLKIGYTVERHRKKGLMKQCCREVLFPIVDKINALYNSNSEYDGLLVGSRMQLICTANPLVCLKFPKTRKEEEEFDWAKDIDEYYWGLHDEQTDTLDGRYTEEARLTQAQADSVWEKIGFTPDESKRRFVTVDRYGESDECYLGRRSIEINRFPKSYPKASSVEKWPCLEPEKKPKKEPPKSG
jgi:hypothetical protein